MSQTTPHLLLVEDDPEIRRLLGDFLTREGCVLETAADSAEMDRVLERLTPDLILLDLMLPGEGGLSICRRLRAKKGIPIIMVTAKNEGVDRIVGLELGADDYISKPFDPRELLARVRAVLRRARPTAPPQGQRRFAFDSFIIDLDAHCLYDKAGKNVALTSAEFDLLACFVQRPRRVLSREQLLDLIHGRTLDPFDRAVDMLVSRLRKKLGAPQLISTIRNSGYIFTAAVVLAT